MKDPLKYILCFGIFLAAAHGNVLKTRDAQTCEKLCEKCEGKAIFENETCICTISENGKKSLECLERLQPEDLSPVSGTKHSETVKRSARSKLLRSSKPGDIKYADRIVSYFLDGRPRFETRLRNNSNCLSLGDRPQPNPVTCAPSLKVPYSMLSPPEPNESACERCKPNPVYQAIMSPPNPVVGTVYQIQNQAPNMSNRPPHMDETVEEQSETPDYGHSIQNLHPSSSIPGSLTPVPPETPPNPMNIQLLTDHCVRGNKLLELCLHELANSNWQGAPPGMRYDPIATMPRTPLVMDPYASRRTNPVGPRKIENYSPQSRYQNYPDNPAMFSSENSAKSTQIPAAKLSTEIKTAMPIDSTSSSRVDRYKNSAVDEVKNDSWNENLDEMYETIPTSEK